MPKTLELQEPALDDHLGAFLDNIMRSLVHIQQQIEITETKDSWNINMLLMIGPYDFISDTRSTYAQRHSLLLELRDRLNKMALLVTQYRNTLVNPSLGDRQSPLAIAMLSNWKELEALQNQIAALPEA
jgi:hypothetical protein